ncbi:MAG: NB-ARC domain-containing protein [Pseudanabaenaceae cyanobacterium]
MLATSDPIEQAFSEAAQEWDLTRLYHDLEKISAKELKPIEKACLRGLLCRYRPGQIAHKLAWTAGALRVELNKGLYRYIEALTGQPPNTLRWEKISEWLANYRYPDRQAAPTPTHIDWGEAPEVRQFFGRRDELQTLQQWIVHDRCRVVAIWGMGGIGKTALAVKLVEQINHHFSLVLWRSLRYVLPLSQVIEGWSKKLGNTEGDLLAALKQQRCLLVIDDFEAVLQDGELAGSYRLGCESYGTLLRRLGAERHQSCVLILSREHPKEILLLQGEELPVRSLKLQGMQLEGAKELLRAKGFDPNLTGVNELIQQYRGNPSALKLVALTIKELFNGNVAEFLRQTALSLGDVLRSLLYEQFNRLSDLEKEILYWLALKRRPIGLQELREAMAISSSGSELIDALESLRWRSLIEKSPDAEVQFTLEPVVMKYVHQKLMEEITLEINAIIEHQDFTSLYFLQRFPLVEDSAPDNIRAVQIRLLLKPIKDKTHALLKKNNITTDTIQTNLRQLVSTERLENNLVLLGLWLDREPS